jgi:peptidoglycan/xylan/chitin deacetylase (PgdA/CDA1 family)
MPSRALKDLVRRRVLGSWLVERGPAHRPAVALTFDDGPNADNTPLILDTLKRHGAVATFFIIGQHAKAHPQLIERIAAEGHELGNHSMTHAEFAQISLNEIHDEVIGADRLIQQWGVPQERIWFRPPKGVLNLRTIWYAISHSRKYAMWSNDPKDFAANSAAELATHFGTHEPRAGEIVLLHDSSPATVGYLDTLLESIQARGLRTVTLSQLVS